MAKCDRDELGLSEALSLLCVVALGAIAARAEGARAVVGAGLPRTESVESRRPHAGSRMATPRSDARRRFPNYNGVYENLSPSVTVRFTTGLLWSSVAGEVLLAESSVS